MTEKHNIILHSANQAKLVRLAGSDEYHGIELDLRATRDGIVVVRHNRRFRDGNGRNLWIDHVSLEEALRQGVEQMVTLDELLQTAVILAKKKPNFILDLDIKQSDIHNHVYALLEKHRVFDAVSEVIISSPDLWTLQAYNDLDERFTLALTLSSLSSNDRYDLYDLKLIRYIAVVLQYSLKPIIFRLIRRKARKKDIHYANIYHKLVNADIVSFLHAQEIKVFAYPVESRKQMKRLQALGVDGLKIKMPFR